MDESFKRWVTGFFEGDGSVGVYPSGLWATPMVKVTFTQNSEELLEAIRTVVGCGVLSRGERNQYRLQFNGSKALPLLSAFSGYVVSRYYCDRLNVALEARGLELCVTHVPSEEWFAGFWDAEGTVELTGQMQASLYIGLSQKSADVLDAVCRFLCLGRVGEYPSGAHVDFRWYVTSNNALKVSKILLEYSRHVEKREHLESVVRELYERRGVREWMRLHPAEVETIKLKALGSEVLS